MNPSCSSPSVHNGETTEAKGARVEPRSGEAFSNLSLSFGVGLYFSIYMPPDRADMARELADAINSIVAKHTAKEAA